METKTGKVKAMAAAFALLFAVGKIYSMITAINLLTAALGRMNIAMGAGLIGPMTKGAAKGGLFATAGVALAGGGFFNNLGGQIVGAIPGTKAYKQKTASKVLGGNLPMSPSASDVMFGNVKGTATGGIPKANSELQAFIDALNAANKSLKTAKTLQDKINAEAVRQNLARQARLSGSSTIAIGGAGSLSYGNKGTNVVVNVAGSVSTQEDLVTSIVNGIERTTRRSFGTVGAFDR